MFQPVTLTTSAHVKVHSLSYNGEPVVFDQPDVPRHSRIRDLLLDAIDRLCRLSGHAGGCAINRRLGGPLF